MFNHTIKLKTTLTLVFTLALALYFVTVTFSQNENFTMTQVACDLSQPWDVTYGPDDHLWVMESKSYELIRINLSNGNQQVILDASGMKNFTMYNNSNSPQGGFTGLALHPDLLTGKPYVYLGYVYEFESCVNGFENCIYKTKVVRYNYNASNNSLSNELILCDTIPGSTDHNGGRMTIGEVNGSPYLFFGVGDMGAGQFTNALRPNHAQESEFYEGKILRFNLEPDGDSGNFDRWIPNNNPYNGSIQSAVWSIGHRNPQGLAYGDNGILYSAEHGAFTDDELNIIESGKNYGHPLIGGFADGNYNNSKLGTGGALPFIFSEQNNAATIGATYRDPIASFFPASQTLVNEYWLNEVNGTQPFPFYYFSWEGIAHSGCEFYGSSTIPNWENSILLASLKRSTVYRVKLSSDGQSVVGDEIKYFEGMGRFRDIAISPDGTKIFVACDSTGLTSGPTAGTTVVPPNKGCILQFEYQPPTTSSITLNCSPDLEFSTNATTGLVTFNYVNASGSTDCPSGGLNIVKTSGVNSGSSLGVGTYPVTFEATDACGNTETCSFVITIVAGNTGGDCVPSIAGFSVLGEYDNSKYFISNEVSNPLDAQVVAFQNNGWLAVINNQAENDFIQQNISEMVYIGLNDALSEGNLAWVNGEALNFNNIDPCSFCNENSSDLDYVIMAPWDGKWSFSSQWNSRKYIVEIPCNTTSSSITLNCPSDIQFSTDPNTGLANINFADATGSTDCPNGGLNISKTGGVNSGSNIGVGVYSVSYEATDACGNTENCSFNVTVVAGTGGTPDLTLSNLSGLPNSTEVGNQINLTFDLNNIGTGAVSGDFVIAAYLSTDPLFGGGDTYLADITKGNTPIGTESNIPFSFTVPNLPDGDYYFIIVADVNGDVQELIPNNNSITEPISIGTSTGGGCPPSIAGFTVLGEFGNSKYFISNEISKPADAQLVAEQNGGYLVAINDQAENDFIQQNISEMVYIGLNDAQSEGNLEWVNGDALTYNNVDPCGFCSENSDNLDYVIIAPWNGSWSFSSQWNSRNYIVEVSCGTTLDLPDLTITDASGLSSSTQIGVSQEVSYQIDNVGTLEANNVSISAYLSSDDIFDTGDIFRDGEVYNSLGGGNFKNGNLSFSIPQVSYGDYFILLIVDSGNTVQELDETNNIFAIPIGIYALVDPPSSFLCNYENTDLGTGTLSCSEVNSDDSFALIINSANGVLENNYSADGTLQFSTSIPFEYEFFTMENNAITKANQGGTVSLSIPLSTAITNQFSIDSSGYAGVAPLDNNTFLVMAYERINTHNPYPNWWNGFDVLYALRVDDSGVLIDQMFIDSISFSVEPTVYHGIVLSETGVGSLIYKQRGYSTGLVYELAIENDLSISNKKQIARSWREHATTPPIGPYVTISPSPCSPYQYKFSIDASTNGSNGSDFSNFHYEILKDFSTPISEDIYWEEDLSAGLTGLNKQRNIRKFPMPNSDDRIEVVMNFEQYLSYPPQSYSNIKRYNNADVELWSLNYDFDDMPEVIFENSNGDLLFVFENNGNLLLAAPDCTTSQNCPDDIAGFEYLGEHNGHQYFLSDENAKPIDAQLVAEQNGGYLTVINDQAENDFLQQNISEMVYIGLNDTQTEGTPAWVEGTSSFTNFDVCSFCNENSTSLDYVVMHNWNGGWSWSSQWNARKYIVEISCPNPLVTPPISNTLIAFPTEKEDQLMLEDIIPNPASNQIFVSLYSPTEDNVALQVFDARGVLVKSEIVELYDGDNTVELDIADLSDGIYLINTNQGNGKTATQRFVKLSN